MWWKEEGSWLYRYSMSVAGLDHNQCTSYMWTKYIITIMLTPSILTITMMKITVTLTRYKKSSILLSQLGLTIMWACSSPRTNWYFSSMASPGPSAQKQPQPPSSSRSKLIPTLWMSPWYHPLPQSKSIKPMMMPGYQNRYKK